MTMHEITRVLQAIERGQASAVSELLPLVYDELRCLAAHKLDLERAGQTLEATGLVHEAYLRLAGGIGFENRRHFFAAAAEAMRRILIDNARRKSRTKHGGDYQRRHFKPELAISPSEDPDVLALDEALQRLAVLHPQKARLVQLRFFAGLTGEQAAEILGVSASTADRDWVFARAWLRREMAADHR